VGPESAGLENVRSGNAGQENEQEALLSQTLVSRNSATTKYRYRVALFA